MSTYTIIPPTPIPNNVTLPPVGNPAFPGLALQYVNFWVNTWVPGFNDLNDNVWNNAKYVEEKAGEMQGVVDLANASAAALEAKLWASGGTYVAATTSVAASVVVSPAKPNTTYRCILNVSGSATDPSADPTHWVELVHVNLVHRSGSVDLGNVSGAVNLDMGSNEHIKCTVTGNVTFSVTNVPAAGTMGGFVLEIANGGAHTVTLWGGIHRPSGWAPTLTTSGTDLLVYWTADGGTTWHETVQSLGEQ